MNTRHARSVGRAAAALLVAAALGGCVYAPPYAAYDPAYPSYSYPAYVGPPISLDLGFGFYDGPRHGHHGWGHHGGWRHHGGGHYRGRGWRGRH
jgi:hypothetical protein